MADMIRTILVEQKMRYEKRIEQLINERNNQEDFIKSLLKTIVEKGDIIENLRKDLDGMGREVDLEKYKNKILTEMFDEQDVIITNLRKDLDRMRKDVNV